MESIVKRVPTRNNNNNNNDANLQKCLIYSNIPARKYTLALET